MMLKQESILNKINPNYSYYINGINGSGKSSLALEIVKAAIKQINPSQINNFPDNYPDYKYLNGGKIEDIRNLLNDISKKPFYDKYFVVIDNINTIDKATQNLLLKPIEENTNIMFVLVSNDDNFVLDTIKSRCHRISPILLDKKLIKKTLLKEYEDIDDIFLDDIVKISNGSLGKCKKYIENEFFKDLINSLKNIKNENFFVLATKCNNNREEKNEIFYLIEYFIKEKMIIGEDNTKFFNIILKMNKYKKELTHNANIQMIFQNIFLDFINA